jgi:hypothetical protein
MDLGGFMSWFDENAFAATHHIRTYADTFDDVLDTALGSYSAFLKEVRLLSWDLLASIKSFSESFFPMTTFDKAKESFTEEFGGLKADTLLILDANETAKTNVATLTASLAEWSAKTAEDILGWNLADLPGSSYARPTGPGSEFYVHSKNLEKWILVYDKAEVAWETAEKTITNTIGAISTQLADWKAQLLDPAIEAGYRDFISNEIKYWEAMLEEFQKQRAEIFEGVDRYMGDLLGTTSELDKSLYSVNTQFQSWLDALIDAGGTLAEQTDLMGDWEAAIRKSMQKPFESMIDMIDAKLTDLSRADWGLSNYMNLYESLSGQTLQTSDPDELLDIFGQQLDVLQKIESLQDQELSALKNVYNSIDDLLFNISGGGDLAAVTSAEFWTGQYDKLLTDAMAGDAEAASAFEQFVPDFLKFMQAYTPDYKGITDYVTQDLQTVQGVIEDSMSELELLTTTNAWLKDIYNELKTSLSAVVTAIESSPVSQEIDPLTGQISLLIPEIKGLTQAILKALFPDSGINMIGDESPTTYYPNPYEYDPLLNYHAAGGLTSGMSIAGEAGPEWVVPTYEPERSSFLRDVGVDTSAIAAAVAARVGSAGGGPIQIDMKVYLDGDQIRHSVAAGANGRDVELINAIRRAARG